MEDALLTQFNQDPVQYLQLSLQQPPSREGASALARQIAASVAAAASPVATLYLQAAARHLPAVYNSNNSGNNMNNSNVARSSNSKADMEIEMKQTQLVYHILEAVGHAVAKCEPRSVIQQSGILAVLANLIPSVSVEDPPTPTTKQTSLLSCPLLGQAHVEFLQACIFAGNFAYAQQITGNTWPKPNATISVRNVLRYFYLRAVVHFECQQYQLAVRCLRTCLCVPADAVSVIALAAWKKLVLIQTLLQSHLANAKPMTLPQTTPSVFTRYIQNATNEEGNRPLPPPAGLVSKASSPDEHLVHMVINLETGEQVPKRGACDVYANLVRAFLQMNANNLHDMLQTHATILTQDGNLALAQRLATELPCRRLYDQSRVYSSIPMTELANLLEMPSTDELGQLLVKVSLQKAWPIQVTEDGMVRFPPLPPTGSSTNAAAATAELLDLTNLVQKLDANLSSSAKFMAVTRKESSSEGGGGGGEKGPSGPRGVEDI